MQSEIGFFLQSIFSFLPSRAYDLVNVLSAILVRSLQVMQLFVEIGNIRFELRDVFLEAIVHVVCGAEHEPECGQIFEMLSQWDRQAHILPTPS